MKWLLIGFASLVGLFLYLPLAIIMLFSFSQKRVLSLPITGWTLDWYQQVMTDTRLQMGVLHSLQVAAVAVPLSAILGTLAALAVQRYNFWGRDLFRSAVALPITLPGIIMGVAMLSFFSSLDIALGLPTLIVGHTTFGVPVVFSTVAARVARLPKSLEEAAADLGSTPWQAFWRVIFPALRSALLAGVLLAFALSSMKLLSRFF
jgi:spermidine/putrescine transport system permease protein